MQVRKFFVVTEQKAVRRTSMQKETEGKLWQNVQTKQLKRKFRTAQPKFDIIWQPINLGKIIFMLFIIYLFF